MTKCKRIFFRILLFFITVSITLVMLEMYLRFFRPVKHRQPPPPLPEDEWYELLHRKSAIPGLAYELAPGMKKFWYRTEISVNSYGMRDTEPLEGDDVRRIIALGDSFTFGFGVAGEETYPNVLESLLNQSEVMGPHRYDVLNMGVSGYSTKEEALVLKHRGMQWEPDLVIIGYFLNDPELTPVQLLQAYYHDVHWWQHSHLLRLAARGIEGWKILRMGDGDYFRYLHAEGSEKWESVVKAFADIRDMTQKKNSKVLLVLFPFIPWEKWEAEYPYEDIHKKVADTARNKGFYVLDLLDAYRDYEPFMLRVSRSDHHINALGHRIAARAIMKRILSKKNLKSNLIDAK